MDVYENALHDMLVELSRALDLIELQWLQQSKDFDLTMSDIHLLAAVSQKKNNAGKTISELSQILNIRLPSVTLAVNKLVQKGYLEKSRNSEDKRIVHVTLTRLGKKAEHAHRYFHRNMTRAITEDMTEDEEKVLLSGLGKLYTYFMSTLPSAKENGQETSSPKKGTTSK